MQKFFSYLLIIILLFSCKTVQQHNTFLETKIKAQKLHHDIDFAYQKLQKLHPNLNWYISKEQLDYKFDSLKNSIDSALTPNQFYYRLAPVIAEAKHGHLKLRPLTKRYTAKEEKELKKKKPLFGRFEYQVIGNQLFIKKNKDSIAGLKVGTEILEINSEKVEDLIKKYRKLYTSDGDNQTFHPHYLGVTFFNYYTMENGLLDSVKLQTRYDNHISTVTLKRELQSREELKKKKQKLSPQQKIHDYNKNTQSYNRSLKFYNDSIVAYVKIKTFSGNYARRFYKETFQKIKKAKSQYLILDIRDNFGGSIWEINHLYSYLAEEKFTLIQKPEMTFRTSPLHQNFFNTLPLGWKIISAPSYPLFLIGNYILGSKKGDKYYFYEPSSKPTKPKKNGFHGKIYVLMNGASFSASSIIAAKLKSEGLATLVGEETGGAHDGAVAGLYNTITLPNSKLKLPIALFLLRPNVPFENQNRGVFPDWTYNENQITAPNKDEMLEFVLRSISQENN